MIDHNIPAITDPQPGDWAERCEQRYEVSRVNWPYVWIKRPHEPRPVMWMIDDWRVWAEKSDAVHAAERKQ